jgi:DedD protein
LGTSVKEQGMQDEDKFRERIQVMLDNRQIFLIFLASSVILALVFSLGFVVGKRSGTRTLAPPPSDTLALLDKMDAGEEEEEDPLTFHEALTGDQVPDAPPAKKAPAKKAPAAGDKENTPDSPAALKVGSLPAPPAPVGQVVSKPTPAPAAKVVAPAPAPVKQPAPVAEAAKVEVPPGPAGGGDYTLQLSAFQDKKEAAQFISTLKETGYKPYMQTSTIPGKGIWFRVRMGSYKTWDEAVVAKQQFEAKKQIIAYVTKK